MTILKISFWLIALFLPLVIIGLLEIFIPPAIAYKCGLFIGLLLGVANQFIQRKYEELLWWLFTND